MHACRVRTKTQGTSFFIPLLSANYVTLRKIYCSVHKHKRLQQPKMVMSYTKSANSRKAASSTKVSIL